MKQLDKLDYNRLILLDSGYAYDCFEQRIYLEKSYFKQKDRDQYFIKAYMLDENKNFVCQGYIYFYMDFDKKESSYIGTYIKPEFRNNNIASLLTSCWIKFCLDNNIYNLNTIKTQRKPFLIYLLKTFSFELKNRNMYDLSKYNIHICGRNNDLLKYLLFENLKQKESFYNSSIFKEDNYYILDKLLPGIEKLDTVILSNPYYVQDNDFAYKKSLKLIDDLKYNRKI